MLYNFLNLCAGMDFEDPKPFVAAAEANIDLAWVVHYLYDAGYLLLDFNQARRANSSKLLDVLWKEFVTHARTGTGHKTNYGILAVMQAYRGEALHPKLAELWHAVRTLPMSARPGARVGHDMPCEWLHADLTRSVQHHVSETKIAQFIAEQPFLKACEEGLRGSLELEADMSETKLKAMDADVARLKDMFCVRIGATWAQAARANTSSQLLSATDSRVKAPWKEYADVAGRKGDDSTAAYVRRHITKYAFRHEWQP